jgi:Lipopolysaccharide-assembly
MNSRIECCGKRSATPLWLSFCADLQRHQAESRPKVRRVRPRAPRLTKVRGLSENSRATARQDGLALPFTLMLSGGAVSLLALLLICGCAGYRLGPTNGMAPGEKSVQVIPFQNQTLEPGLGDALTMQVRKQLQRDGTMRVATHDDGDILLSGVITHYRRQEVTFVPTDVVTVRDYRVSMVAHVTARERGTGKLIFDQPVTNSTLVRVGADLTSSERQGLPLLAESLAKNVTALLVEGTW